MYLSMRYLFMLNLVN